METETVVLSGQACGSGNATYIISGGGPTGLAQAMQGMTRTRVKTAVNAAPHPAATSGTSTWATYSPRFTVSYASYIPVDNIPGPTPCYYQIPGTPEPFPYGLTYKGDAFRGTYRTTQAIFVVPDKQYYGNFFPNAGPTRNYGYGSPANGSTLSSSPTSPDIYNGPYAGADEDNVQDDCHYWNDRGKADLTNMQSYSVTFPSSHQAVITLSGFGQDPLEFKIPGIGIKWNASITLDTTDPNNPTAQATITHTCYPAHNIKVNGVTLLDDQPETNTTGYLSKCLEDPTHVTWTTTTTGAIHVPSH